MRRLVDRPEDVFSDLLLLVFSDFFVDLLRAAIRLSIRDQFLALLFDRSRQTNLENSNADRQPIAKPA
jgi:hypothetical protein